MSVLISEKVRDKGYCWYIGNQQIHACDEKCEKRSCIRLNKCMHIE